MEQVLTPSFNFTPKNLDSTPLEGYDYGEKGYQAGESNVGFNEETGQIHVEINGLAEPKTEYGKRIIEEDLNEVIASFVQDKQSMERGMFDEEVVPQELTQVRMGKIIKDKYPELDEGDAEAVRQYAVTALNLTQKAKEEREKRNESQNEESSGSESPKNEDGNAGNDDEPQTGGDGGSAAERGNTALIDGIRRLAMDVRELEVDWIDSINPFSEAYNILSVAMDEKSLKAMAEVIATKKFKIDLDEARELAKRAAQFKKERGRLPDIKSGDAWEQRMARGVDAFQRYLIEIKNAG